MFSPHKKAETWCRWAGAPGVKGSPRATLSVRKSSLNIWWRREQPGKKVFQVSQLLKLYPNRDLIIYIALDENFIYDNFLFDSTNNVKFSFIQNALLRLQHAKCLELQKTIQLLHSILKILIDSEETNIYDSVVSHPEQHHDNLWIGCDACTN